jgi:hypothetical protein
VLEHLVALFPGLRGTAFKVTSPRDPAYKCIAWAAGVTSAWWWPLDNPEEAFWPEGVPRARTLEAFRAVFATLGYSLCSDDGHEPGFEKVALFADALGLPTHAARQLPNGRWTSKLRKAEDIEHDLRALEGDLYGTVRLVLKRPLPATGGGGTEGPLPSA